jgi:hypothetical protein
VTTFRISSAVTAALAVAAVAAASALAGSTIAFVGTYTGKATAKVTGQTVAISARGTGKGSLIGASRISGLGKGDASNPPCVPFSGPGTITGAGGKLIRFTVLPTSRGCAAQDDQKQVTVTGRIKVTGGTTRFAKAHGTLKFTGHFNRGTGVFTVKLTGALAL